MKAGPSAFGYKKRRRRLHSICCSSLQVMTKAIINRGYKYSSTEPKGGKRSENVHNLKLYCDVTVVRNGVSSSISRWCWWCFVFFLLWFFTGGRKKIRQITRVTGLQLTGLVRSQFPWAVTANAQLHEADGKRRAMCIVTPGSGTETAITQRKGSGNNVTLTHSSMKPQHNNMKAVKRHRIQTSALKRWHCLDEGLKLLYQVDVCSNYLQQLLLPCSDPWNTVCSPI